MRGLDAGAIGRYLGRRRAGCSVEPSAAYQIEGLGIHLFEADRRRRCNHILGLPLMILLKWFRIGNGFLAI